MTDFSPFARGIRRHALNMVHRAKASHIGGALSCADILAVLYAPGGILNVRPEEAQWHGRDRFIMSKGHSCSALYAALALRGFFHESELMTFAQDGARLSAHASHHVPGVELSTGSLGHGLPFACGLAVAAKRRGQLWRTFVLLSDGELNEGSNWEAFMFAAHHKLENMVIIVDDNGMQGMGPCGEVLGNIGMLNKMEAFGWNNFRVNGHNHAEIYALLGRHRSRPTCVLASTIKGKGVDFMQNELAWHYKPPDMAQLESALAQIGGA